MVSTSLTAPAVPAAFLTAPQSVAPKFPREKACDSCYYQKLKCAFSNDNLACDRCIRCRRDCVSTRPVQRPVRRNLVVRAKGTAARRPPKPKKAKVYSDNESTTTATPESEKSPGGCAIPVKPVRSLNPYGPGFDCISARDESAITRLMHRSNFMQFFVYPKFVEGMHQDMVVHLFSLFEQAKDAYVAMYSSFAIAMNHELEGYDEEENIRRGAVAVKRMRSWKLPTSKAEELMPWAGFGMAIIKFSNFALGVSAPPVRRYILNHIHLLGEDVSGGSVGRHSLFIYLMAVEINECLIRRQVPVCNVGTWEPGLIDMYIGLCLPLLPYLHELCKLSHALFQKTDPEGTMAALDSLERTILDWQPEPPPDFTFNYSTTEVIHMSSQAQVYKHMAILFIHRLRHRFGSQDDVAEAMANAIFTELHRTYAATNEAPKWVTMPYFMAAIEVQGASEREMVMDNLPMFVDAFSPRLQQKYKAFIQSLWKIRDSTKGLVWLDLVSCLPPIYGSI